MTPPTPTDARATLARTVAEGAFQRTIIAYARTHGWRVYHTRFSRGSDRGYPDLTLVRERLVFIELKTARRKLTPDQELWRDALVDAGAEWHCWRPDVPDAEIERVLGRLQPPR